MEYASRRRLHMDLRVASPSIRRVLIRRMAMTASFAVLTVAATATETRAAYPLFAARFLSFDTGYAPYAMAIADLNADGSPDLAVTDFRVNTVQVLLGMGDGTFAVKAYFATGLQPLSVAIGDLNADGKPDLVTANDL
ncbi:MAG: VCBS repeat-containing protein, partial [Candidatus Eisenbacteria bacterium]